MIGIWLHLLSYLDGGNPWYLTTLAAAEQLYDALSVWQQLKQINVTDTSYDFFQAMVPDVTIGSYASESSMLWVICY